MKANRNTCRQQLVGIAGILYLFASCVAMAAGLDSAARGDFEWFNSLGFPDVKGCPCVRIQNGSWSVMGEKPKIFYICGFLVASNRENIALFTVDLLSRTLTNTVTEHGAAAFELLNLHEEAAAQIKAWRSRPDKDDPERRFGAQLEERAEVFTLAWTCWRAGLDEDAQQLYQVAKEMPARMGDHDAWPNFRTAIEKDIAHAMMWRAVVSFGDPTVSRSNILGQMEAVLKNYPHSEHVGQARHFAEVLKRMIAEDEAHARLGPIDLARSRIDGQVRELIYRLRDQNGQQVTQPGSCDIFWNWDGNTNTPAHQLVRLGNAAVPQLIAVLDSDDYTRSIGYWRGFVFSHTVLTVGDCAEEILQRITGKSFVTPDSHHTYMSEADAGGDARRAAEVWWDGFQKTGEKQTLINEVAAAKNDAPAEAELLCQKYPDAATAALIRGARAATDSTVRARLVERIGQMYEPAGAEFLSGELMHGPFLESRVAAAYGLWQHQSTNALTALIAEWNRIGNPQGFEDDTWKPLVEVLSGFDSADAILALGTNLQSRAPEVKFKVLQELGETDRWEDYYKAQPFSPTTLAAVEKVLVGSLTDTERYYSMNYSRNEKGYSDPRICDMAAWFLSDRWPSRYAFDVPGSLTKRDRQRIECLNVWRRTHNQPLVPQPLNRRTPVGREDATKVTLIEWTSDSAKPGKAFEAEVGSLKNRQLNPKDLVHLLTDFAVRPQEDASGLELEAIKDEDLTGVRLVVNLVPGRPPTESEGWDVSEAVTLGTKDIHGSSGGGILEAYREFKDWDEFARAAKQAIDAPPETSFDIRARIASGKNTKITKSAE
jgi:hypothetical protein